MGMTDGKKGVVSNINITPYIDILLVMLIIFMVAVPLKQHDHPIRVPQPAPATQPKDVKPDSIIVDMDLDHTVRLNNQVMTLDKLESTLTAVFSRRAVKNMFIRRGCRPLIRRCFCPVGYCQTFRSWRYRAAAEKERQHAHRLFEGQPLGACPRIGRGRVPGLEGADARRRDAGDVGAHRRGAPTKARCPFQAGTRRAHGGWTTIAALLVVDDVHGHRLLLAPCGRRASPMRATPSNSRTGS